MPTATDEPTEIDVMSECLSQAIQQLEALQTQLHRWQMTACVLAGLLVVIVIGACEVIAR